MFSSINQGIFMLDFNLYIELENHVIKYKRDCLKFVDDVKRESLEIVNIEINIYHQAFNDGLKALGIGISFIIGLCLYWKRSKK